MSHSAVQLDKVIVWDDRHRELTSELVAADNTEHKYIREDSYKVKFFMGIMPQKLLHYLGFHVKKKKVIVTEQLQGSRWQHTIIKEDTLVLHVNKCYYRYMCVFTSVTCYTTYTHI